MWTYSSTVWSSKMDTLKDILQNEHPIIKSEWS